MWIAACESLQTPQSQLYVGTCTEKKYATTCYFIIAMLMPVFRFSTNSISFFLLWNVKVVLCTVNVKKGKHHCFLVSLLLRWRKAAPWHRSAHKNLGSERSFFNGTGINVYACIEVHTATYTHASLPDWSVAFTLL
jgi:hypothetical protein